MDTLRISLPEGVKAIVDQQIAHGRFANESEYVCRLIEDDERRQAQDHLESLLLARVTGSESIEMDSADWIQMRKEFHRRVTAEGMR